MIQVYNDKSCCSGCTACYSSCPKSALSMASDEHGFKYPIIDKDLCIDCKICQNICPFKKPLSKVEERYPICYGATNRNENVKLASRSGGVFIELCKEILSMSGLIYGVSLDKDFVVRHHRATTIEEAKRFSKSKYVQSDLKESIKSVAKDLSEGKYVLFSGTACQCDAVKAYVSFKKIKADNLLLVDVICHGVPSPLIFKKYLKWVEEKNNGKITDYQFRMKNKNFHWGNCVEGITINNKTIYQDNFVGDLFYYGYTMRPSCHNCKYSNINRVSDITLGDFWGIEKINNQPFDIKKGVSLLLVSTSKGESFFDRIKDNLNVLPVKTSDVMQPALSSPCDKPEKYDEFWSDFDTMQFDEFWEKHSKNQYVRQSKISELMHRVWNKIRK